MKQKIKIILRKLKIINGRPLGLRIINFIFQRILRINSKLKVPIHFTSRVNVPEKFHFNLDKNTLASFSASSCCYLQAWNGVYLGKNILFAKGLNLISANHSVGKSESWDKVEPIIIGDDVWIGVNATILPGVKIGNNCIIGAGSIITKSFEEDNLIIAGNPAKIIKRYK